MCILESPQKKVVEAAKTVSQSLAAAMTRMPSVVSNASILFVQMIKVAAGGTDPWTIKSQVKITSQTIKTNIGSKTNTKWRIIGKRGNVTSKHEPQAESSKT